VKIVTTIVMLIFVGALVASCGSADRPDTPVRTATLNGTPDMPASSAKDALTLGGLPLPDGATKVTFASIAGTPYVEAYLE